MIVSAVEDQNETSAAAPEPTWLPKWIEQLGTPVWVCDPNQELRFVNPRAVVWLELDGTPGPPAPCHEIVHGESVCQRDCPIVRRAREGGEIEPFRIRRKDESGRKHWAQVLAIPLTGPDGSFPWIVHTLLGQDRVERIEAYLRRVAGRSAGVPRLSELSPRESEILGRLASDQTSKRVAFELGISYATVRNHIQHLLAKLGVHSIEEAIAVKLIADE